VRFIRLESHQEQDSNNELSRDSDLNLYTRLQADAGDLLDNLAGGVQVDQTLVHLEFVPVPSLGTLSTGGFTGGDLQDLGGKADGALDAELLVLSTVDEIGREFFQVLDVAAGEGNPDLVDFCSRYGCTCSVVFFFSFSDVTHFEVM